MIQEKVIQGNWMKGKGIRLNVVVANFILAGFYVLR